jgi:hypothetical protein
MTRATLTKAFLPVLLVAVCASGSVFAQGAADHVKEGVNHAKEGISHALQSPIRCYDQSPRAAQNLSAAS